MYILLTTGNEDGCDFIIALTHMRVPNDKLVAKECKGVDLFLGGHDHIYYHEQIGNLGNVFIKSGVDFKSLSLIEIEFRQPEEGEEFQKKVVHDKNVKIGQKYKYYSRQSFVVGVTRLDIVSDIPIDEEIRSFVNQSYADLEKEMSKKLCWLEGPLDATFEGVRSRETNLGNFLADMLRKELIADMAIIQGGSIRADKLYPTGFLTLGDLFDIHPFKAKMIVKELKGRYIMDFLEAAVSKLPALEGRFLQTSKINVSYDLDQPAGERVIKDSVLIGGKPLDLNKTYTVAMPEYIGSGKDGFGCLLNGKCITDKETAISMRDILLSFCEYVWKEDTYREFLLARKHGDVFSPQNLIPFMEHRSSKLKDKLKFAVCKLTESMGRQSSIRRQQKNRNDRFVSCLTEENVEQIKSAIMNKHIEVSTNLIKRLQKYTLIHDIKEVDGQRYICINPVLQDRSVFVSE